MGGRPRRALVSTLLVAGALAACSSGSGPGRPSSAASRAASSAADSAPAGAPLSEAECMQLLDHYLELALAEKRATLPAEQVPTPEQVARIRGAMREEAAQACVGRAERGRYECAMKAQTARAVGACLGEAQAGG